ncbi:hypothetical protein [Aquiflexum sp.]
MTTNPAKKTYLNGVIELTCQMKMTLFVVVTVRHIKMPDTQLV